jgi:peptidoglycan/LPS O-acetylase OafA/YrhL
MDTSSNLSSQPAGSSWLRSAGDAVGRALGISTAPDRAYPLGYLAALDGIRGIMTLGVLCAHTRYLLMPGAIVYMDIFFTMSGYLITGLLISEYRKTSTINFKAFYIRRLMRLYPALAAMLVALLIVAALFSTEFGKRVIDAAVAFFYISNYWRAFNGPGLWYTTHTWSLSLEEQFYLLWPLTFFILVRWLGLSWRMVGMLLALALGFWAWRAWLTYDGASIVRLYNSFDTRADSLLIGAALAIVLKLVDLSQYPRLGTALAWSLLPLAVFGLWCGQNMHDTMRWYYYVSPLFGSIPGAIAIAAIAQPRRTFMNTFYEIPVFVFCGRICYGLYIWHYPIFSLLRGYFNFPYIGIFLVGWPIAFALAIASYYWIERPFMRARPL